ncbi:MAG: hypothetical protein ACREB3_11845 [Burkholderiales bacterium]
MLVRQILRREDFIRLTPLDQKTAALDRNRRSGVHCPHRFLSQGSFLTGTATPSPLPGAPTISAGDVFFDRGDERVEPLVRALSGFGPFGDLARVFLLHLGEPDLGFHKPAVQSRQGHDRFGMLRERFVVLDERFANLLHIRSKLSLLPENKFHGTFHFFMSHTGLSLARAGRPRLPVKAGVLQALADA